MRGRKREKIEIAVRFLTILLMISLAALAGILFYRYCYVPKRSSTVVPHELVASAENPSPGFGEKGVLELSKAENVPKEKRAGEISRPAKNRPDRFASPNFHTRPEAAILLLYEKHPEDNVPFNVLNMFPGDSETRYYCVRAYHRGPVTVKYRADVRPGYEKLAERLKCRIVLLTEGETLYDGLMRDMPRGLEHTLKKDSETELYYMITAYLETSVGNEYQDKELFADFRWWVEERKPRPPFIPGVVVPVPIVPTPIIPTPTVPGVTEPGEKEPGEKEPGEKEPGEKEPGKLAPLPDTGEKIYSTLLACLSAACCVVLIILLSRKREAKT